MAIEDFQKIADLLLKSIAATAIAGGGLYVSLNKNRLDQSSACLGMSEKLYAPVESTIALERKQKRMSILIDSYNDACKQLADSEVDFLMNSLLPTQNVELNKPDLDPRVIGHDTSAGTSDSGEQFVQADLGVSGWLAIGRIGGSYGQINFDNAEDLLIRPLPTQKNSILKARWAVNLRGNTSNTKGGSNPTLSTLEPGDCISTSALTEVRGQVWALGKVVNCE